MNNQYAPPTANLDALPGDGGGITNAMLEALRKTKGWVLLVGIMLFLLAAFTILAALITVFASSMLGTGNDVPGVPRGVTIGMGIAYFIFALVYGALGFYLVKYGSAISQLNRDGSSESMEIALQHQQKFWRLAGVLMLLFLLFFVFAIGAAIVLPGMMALKGLPG